MDSRVSERVSHLSDMIKALATEMVEARASLTPTRKARDHAIQEASNVELFLKGLEGQLRCLATADEEDQVANDTKRIILQEMKTEHELTLVNCKRDAEKKEEEL